MDKKRRRLKLCTCITCVQHQSLHHKTGTRTPGVYLTEAVYKNHQRVEADRLASEDTIQDSIEFAAMGATLAKQRGPQNHELLFNEATHTHNVHGNMELDESPVNVGDHGDNMMQGKSYSFESSITLLRPFLR